MSRALLIQTLALGDLIMTTPLMAALTAAGFHLTVLARREYSRILEGPGLAHEFIGLDLGQLAHAANQNPSTAVVQTLRELGPLAKRLGQGYNLVINPCFNGLGAGLAFLSRPGRLVGARLTQEGFLVLDAPWYAAALTGIHGPGFNHFHLADLHLLAAGLETHEPGYRFALNKADQQNASQILEKAGVGTDAHLVAIHPGAGHAYRQWPADNFASVGKRLVELGLTPLITGSRREAGLAARVSRLIGPKAKDISGQTGLGSLAAILSRCRFVLTNDTGPGHLAAAVGTPVVGVFLGKARFACTGPYGKGHLALEAGLDCAPCAHPEDCHHLNCRQAITCDDMMSAINHLLGRDPDPPAGSRARLYTSFLDSRGLMEWRPLANAHPDFDAAQWFKQLWLELLDPNEKKPPSNPSPQPASSPFHPAWKLAEEGRAAAERITHLLVNNTNIRALSLEANRLGQVHGLINQAFSRHRLLEPIGLFLVYCLAGLPDTEPAAMARAQAGLFGLAARAVARAARLNQP